MSAGPVALVLGGGLSGMAAAYALARAGWRRVTVLERSPELGGLAGTFESAGHFYPLAYHHILHRDRPLHFFLDAIGALPDVRWRRIRMLFRLGETLYDLSRPGDFLRFPMSLPDKVRFAVLMLRAFGKRDWNEWKHLSAEELIDRWAGPGVRRAIFEPLTRLKFDLPCAETSAAWLGARLHYREGSSPLGYLPDTNWTKVLCDGITRLLREESVVCRVSSRVMEITTGPAGIESVRTDDGAVFPAEVVVNTLPTETYCGLVTDDRTDGLREIRYSAIVSAMCATRQTIGPEFYWMNLASLDCHACGLFLLNSLNPTIGAPGDACVNFVTHVQSRDRDFFKKGDDEVWAAYREDFRRIFGFELEPFWHRVVRVSMYSPVFHVGYDNPPARSTTHDNVYFAGNYRTFPSIASTGTALASGLEAARAVLRDRGQDSELADAAARFRLPSMPSD